MVIFKNSDEHIHLAITDHNSNYGDMIVHRDIIDISNMDYYERFAINKNYCEYLNSLDIIIDNVNFFFQKSRYCNRILIKLNGGHSIIDLQCGDISYLTNEYSFIKKFKEDSKEYKGHVIKLKIK